MKHLLNLNLGVILARHWQNLVPSFASRTTERTSVHWKRFFCAYAFMVGAVKVLRDAVFCSGNANFTVPATLLIRINGGSPQTYRRLHHA
jgi:hypothetical protein